MVLIIKVEFLNYLSGTSFNFALFAIPPWSILLARIVNNLLSLIFCRMNKRFGAPLFTICFCDFMMWFRSLNLTFFAKNND